MKPPIILKTILDICLFFSAISLITSISFFILELYSGEDFTEISVNGIEITELSTSIIILILGEFLVAALFIYTIYILRKLIRNFFKGKLFTVYQIASLKLIGYLIILSTLCQGIINFLAPILLTQRAEFRVELDLKFGSFWFILAIGLFFTFLSKVFENAKNLKEENELTV